MALQGSSSRFRCGLFFLLDTRQGEQGTLGMMSDNTSLPLAMSLPGNYNGTSFVQQILQLNNQQLVHMLGNKIQWKWHKKTKKASKLRAHLPLKFTVWPVPISADGGGHVAADTAFWEQVKGGEFLIIQEGVAVILIAHRNRGEEFLTALWTGNTSATWRQVPSAKRWPLLT